MKNVCNNKSLVFGIVILFIGVGVFPVTGFIDKNENFIGNQIQIESEPQNSATSKDIDWWPMFHHDLQLTGYSTSIATDTNNVLWRTDFNYDPLMSSPAIVNNRIYIGGIDCEIPISEEIFENNIHRFRKDYFQYKSQHYFDELPKRKVSSMLWEGMIYCLDIENGNFLWKHYFSDSFQVFTSPVYYEDKVYISTFNEDFDNPLGHIYCIDAFYGFEIWNFSLVQAYSSPIVSNGVVYAITINPINTSPYLCKLYCLDAETGMELSNFSIGDGEPVGTPTFKDGRIYVSVYERNNRNTYLYCLNTDNGNELWHNYIGEYPGSSPVLYEDRVIVSSTSWDGSDGVSGNITCFDSLTGNELWSFYTEGVSNQQSTPAVGYDRVYFACSHFMYDRGIMYCLNINNGNFIWSQPVGEWIWTSPAIADDKVYFCSNGYYPDLEMDGNVYCLDAENGDVIWSYWLIEGTWSSPAIALENIFIICSDFAYGFKDTNMPNRAPNLSISGRRFGIAGKEYEYTFIATDPEGDYVEIYIWISDDPTTMWIVGPIPSGEPATCMKSWEKGKHKITAIAQDTNYAWSEWEELEVTILRKKSKTSPLLLRCIEQLPLLERLLTPLIK